MSNATLDKDRQMTALLDALNGQTVELDGISGTIRYSPARITHEPDEHGREHPDYAWLRSELGDDWVVDLTGSTATLARIANKLGLRFPY